MKNLRAFSFQQLAVIATVLFGATVQASPLTWFSGPSIDTPLTQAASIVVNSNNVLVGGYSDYTVDGMGYLTSLNGTNAYWGFLGNIYSVNIAPGAAYTDGNIVLYGGTDGTTAQNIATAYNLTGDTITQPPNMHVARAYLGYAPDRNGNAYAFGGLDDSGNALGSVERYNPGNNSWAYTASLPAARFDFPAVFNRTNYIYIFGGYTDTVSGIESSSVLRYNVSGNSWSNMAAMPIAVAGSAATLGPDGKIYVCGGTTGGVATDTVQVYNPISNSWTLSTSLPEALTGASAGVDRLGRLVVMGGTDINGLPVADVWRSQQVNLPDSIPVFTSYPSLAATYQMAYDSSIAATGNPQPTYQLISGPDGMAVDALTGAITWTPNASQIGTNSVTIAASNYAGATNYTYNLVIANPPPAPLTNLAVLNVTEFSATLSWAPEDPVVGPVTYGVYLKHVLHDPKGSGSTVWYTLLGSTTNTSITISGLTPNSSTAFYIQAIGVSGVSGYAVIAATTTGPQPPVNFHMIGLTSTSITLAWDPSNSPVATPRYEIWGWINNGVNYTSYGTNFTGNTATITGLAPGSLHQWGIRAFDAAGYVSGFNYGFTVANPVPVAPQLGSAALNADGSFQLTASEGGSVLQTVLIQATDNPADANSWVQIGSLLPGSNPFTFTDTNAAQFPIRFYRMVAP